MTENVKKLSKFSGIEKYSYDYLKMLIDNDDKLLIGEEVSN